MRGHQWCITGGKCGLRTTLTSISAPLGLGKYPRVRRRSVRGIAVALWRRFGIDTRCRGLGGALRTLAGRAHLSLLRRDSTRAAFRDAAGNATLGCHAVLHLRIPFRWRCLVLLYTRHGYRRVKPARSAQRQGLLRCNGLARVCNRRPDPFRHKGKGGTLGASPRLFCASTFVGAIVLRGGTRTHRFHISTPQPISEKH